MRSTMIIDFVLGFALQFFQSQENDDAVRYLDKVIALKKSGSNVDAHLRLVADILLGDEEPDFVGLKSRIDDEVNELLSRGAGDPDPVDPDPSPVVSDDESGDEGGSGIDDGSDSGSDDSDDGSGDDDGNSL